jgi:hypothetical protein
MKIDHVVIKQQGGSAAEFQVETRLPTGAITHPFQPMGFAPERVILLALSPPLKSIKVAPPGSSLATINPVLNTSGEFRGEAPIERSGLAPTPRIVPRRCERRGRPRK